MTIAYYVIAFAILLSIIDVKELWGKGQKKTIWVYAVFMAAAVGLSIWFSLNHLRSILEIIFNAMG